MFLNIIAYICYKRKKETEITLQEKSTLISKQRDTVLDMDCRN